MPVFINLPSDITKVDNNIPSGSGKTITSLTQTDGVISATFSNISITKSQVSDFPDVVNDVTYSNKQLKVAKNGEAATAIIDVTDNSTATALSNSSTKLITERSVALGGYAKSASYTNTSGTTSTITADANGVIDFSSIQITCIPD